MPDSLYDPARYDTLHPVYTREQCRRGGLKRAATAKRHPVYKIFLPNAMLFDDVLFPDLYKHGRAGGLARIGKAQRDKKGRFTK